jgi:CRISPR-associated protein Csd1
MILQALNGYYERVAAGADGGIAPAGFSEQKIAFEVILRPDGTIADVNDLRVQQGRRLVPRLMLVPQPPKRSGRNPPPAFLWDKTGYVFGVERDEADKAKTVVSEAYHAAFRDKHLEMLDGADDGGLQAVISFLMSWKPDDYAALRHANDMLDQNVVFRLDGERGWIHERLVARNIWNAQLGSAVGADGLCLVTGHSAPVARLHPSIKGVQGAQSSGASIISFNLDAFQSYGKEQGANAPVSEAATFAYTTALNSMLSRTSGRDAKDRPIYRNRVQIGDATTVFWAEAANADLAELSEDLMAALLNPPDDSSDDDASATTKLRDVVKQMADGRPLEQAAPNFAADTKFYILGLSPNAARISVRFWHQTALGELGAAFVQHWQDLRIEPLPWRTAPSIWRLLIETAPQRKSDNVQPNLAGEVMRAILDRTRYPATLLTSVVMRMRADGGRVERGSEQSSIGHRAALIKACLIRQKERVPVSLDRTNTNAGYRLGRLFAVLETTQRAALPGLSATIRDRYFGAASAAPASVFPVLIRNSNHHLSNLRKGDKGGLAVWLEREIGEVIDGMAAQFPASLRMQEQGQFAIGYYHQRFAKRADKPAEIAEDATISSDTTE